MLKYGLLGGGLIAGAIWAGQGLADSHENITISHGFSNFGELKYDQGFTHLDYVNVDAPKGGEISIWAQGTFDSFNPYARQGVAAAQVTLLFESILVGTADDPYGSYCYLCTTMEYPDSLDWVIFNLRDDVTFSDGRPFSAEDVKFTFDLFMEQGIAEYRNAYGGFIESVDVLDTHRIKFTFTEQASRRDVIGFAGGTQAFSKSWFEETGARIDESADTPYLGTGPYVLESFDINRQLIYRANPDFWGADHPMNVGQNNFDAIRVEYYADSDAAFQGFTGGDYTFRSENSSKKWATAYEFPAVENEWVNVEELPDGTIGYAQAFVFNLRDERWQDPNVREAIRLGFNFEWSNETLFYGLYSRVNSFWENSELEATGTPSESEVALLQPLVDDGLLDASILTDEAVMSPTSGTSLADRRNLRRAAQLLDEAGWISGDDGIRRKDGEELTVVILQRSPAFDRIVNPYVENLQRLGVQATLERVDNSEYIERRRSADYDLVNHGFSMGYEPGNGLRQWYGSETAEDSSRNLMGLRSEAVDRLINVVIEAENLEDMTTATHALDRVLRAEGFWVPQWFKEVHTVAYYDQYRYPDPLPPLSRGELSFWWYDAEAGAALQAAGALR
ncbi:extracellular solute-binding protein [Aestuariibius sp. HNIBRBA575]|uniref:extracellular solute-binding protein n=1 Tax=Aestuariibius sp. HNIBRBA575 TaxID=3233343 RepID=UPI0034A50A5C